MNTSEPKVPVDIPYVRSLLLTNKSFLRSLYEAKKKPILFSLIDNASNEEILLLLKIFYLEANGAIKLYGSDIKELKSKKKVCLFKKHFSEEGNFNILLLEDMSLKKELLKKFVPVFKVLMSPLFTGK